MHTENITNVGQCSGRIDALTSLIREYVGYAVNAPDSEMKSYYLERVCAMSDEINSINKLWWEESLKRDWYRFEDL